MLTKYRLRLRCLTASSLTSTQCVNRSDRFWPGASWDPGAPCTTSAAILRSVSAGGVSRVDVGPILGLNSHVVSVLQDQVLSFLKDIFDLDKVRYSSVDSLAEDMLRLLHRRSELLLAYLETDSLLHLSGCSSPQVQLMPGTLLKAGVQWESPEICSWTESRSPARPCHDLLDQRNPLRAQKNTVLIVRVWTPSHHVLQRTSCSTDLHTQQSLCRNSTSFLVNTR